MLSPRPNQKEGLGPVSQERWARIFDSIMAQTNDEITAAKMANGLTRASVSRRMAKKKADTKGLP